MYDGYWPTAAIRNQTYYDRNRCIATIPGAESRDCTELNYAFPEGPLSSSLIPHTVECAADPVHQRRCDGVAPKGSHWP